MITIDVVVATVTGLNRAQVERWIAEDWVRPRGTDGEWRFAPIDVARLRLIQELRNDLGVDEAALPVVLHLMDQLYDARRRLRRLCDAVEQTTQADARQALLQVVTELAGRDENESDS